VCVCGCESGSREWDSLDRTFPICSFVFCTRAPIRNHIRIIAQRRGDGIAATYGLDHAETTPPEMAIAYEAME
jgi:hypothetical protein